MRVAVFACVQNEVCFVSGNDQSSCCPGHVCTPAGADSSAQLEAHVVQKVMTGAAASLGVCKRVSAALNA